MILLNTKSILQCNEKETKIHNKEIEMMFNQHLSSNPNLCQVTTTYLDPHQKETKTETSQVINIYELDDFIQKYDIKNGLDVLVDTNNYDIILHLFGQGYWFDNDAHLVTTQLRITKV
mgnify:CR=1 FL=1